MNRPDILILGMNLFEGQFITSLEKTYFAGIVLGQFGVFAGTPSNPIGTSIVLGPPASRVQILPNGALGTFTNYYDSDPSWSTPTVDGPTYCVMQSDGNLCVYAGTPGNQGKFLFGSLQAGGRTSGLLPFLQQRSDVVVSTFNVNISSWCVVTQGQVEGPRVSPPYEGNSTTFIDGRLGDICFLRAYDHLGGHDDSADNFRLGQKGVAYNARKPLNLKDTVSWKRVS